MSHSTEQVGLRCPGCSEATEPDWEFCEGCGEMLPVGDGTAVRMTDQHPVDLIAAYMRPGAFRDNSGDDGDTHLSMRRPEESDDQDRTAVVSAGTDDKTRDHGYHRRVATRTGIACLVL